MSKKSNSGGNPNPVWKGTGVTEVVGWQFYGDGEWHTGMNKFNHRENTEAAGYKIRELYAGPVMQTQADKVPDNQIEKLAVTLSRETSDPDPNETACYLYDAGVRVLAPDERICKPLSDEQIEVVRRHFRFAVDYECLLTVIDAVQRELGLIEG